MTSKNSRQYIKRVWRVPKNRGPAEYLATLICKLMIKHGWPAVSEIVGSQTFTISHKFSGDCAENDFWEAFDTASRIIARTYRVEILTGRGYVELGRNYTVNAHGVFKEVSSL